MCVQSETLSPAKHFLLSAYGPRWREVNLVMFTVYLDDSGTSPAQRSAVAAALIVPSRQIERLESVWGNLKRKHGFEDLHASECAFGRNKEESPFFGWNDDKVKQVFSRTCEISKKYGVKALSYALKKADYDEALTDEWRKIGGKNHYTWCVRWLIRQIENWHADHGAGFPLEFVFDWPDKKSKEEIERVLSQEESVYPGRYEGHYAFKHREQLAGLQCADLLAWTHFQAARKVFEKTPINPFAEANWIAYSRHSNIHEWMQLYTDKSKDDLISTMRDDQSNRPSAEQRERWMEEYKVACKKSGRSVPV